MWRRERRQLRSNISKALLRWNKRALAASFDAWVEGKQTMKRRRHGATKIVARIVLRLQARAFAAWCSMWERGVYTRQLLSQTAARWSKRAMSVCFYRW